MYSEVIVAQHYPQAIVTQCCLRSLLPNRETSLSILLDFITQFSLVHTFTLCLWRSILILYDPYCSRHLILLLKSNFNVVSYFVWSPMYQAWDCFCKILSINAILFQPIRLCTIFLFSCTDKVSSLQQYPCDLNFDSSTILITSYKWLPIKTVNRSEGFIYPVTKFIDYTTYIGL
jgi:hypothetical protein